MRTKAFAAAVLCFSSAVGRADTTPKAAPLSIVELGEAKDLKWADVKTPDVIIPLTLQNTTANELKNVRVDVTPFVTTSQSIHGLVNDQPDGVLIPSIVRSGRAAITIKATLTAGGTYRSHLTVRQDTNLIANVALEVARTRVAPPLEMTTPPAKAVSLWPASKKSTTFKIQLVGSGGAFSLDKPVQKSIEYRESADAKTALTAADMDVSFKPSSALTVDQSPVTVDVTVAGIGTPGRYDVIVGFGGPAYATTATTLTIYARQSGWIAAFCIFVGIVLSWIIRYYSTIGRPVLQNKERASRLFSELDEDARLANGDAHAVALAQEVRRGLTGQWESLARDGKLTDATALDVYAKKIALLPLWLQLWARVSGVRPASVAGTFRAQLIAAEGMFRNRAADAKAVDDQVPVLTGMTVAIDDEITKTLGGQIDEILDRAAKDARFATIAREAEAVQKRLAAVDAKGNLQDIAAEVERVRLRYFAAAADDLTRRVAVKPDWAGDSWTTFAAAINDSLRRVRTAASTADAASAYRDALTTYMRSVVDGLLVDIAARTADPGDGSGRSVQAADYELVAKKVELIPPIIDRGELADAWDALQTAQAMYSDIRARGRKGAMGALGARFGVLAGAPAPAPADFDVISVVPGESPVEEVTGPGAFAAFEGRRLTWDVVVSIVIAIAAVLAGLQALWVDNSTWGGSRSMLAAFLWGLAFDQFSYAGLVALVKRK